MIWGRLVTTPSYNYTAFIKTKRQRSQPLAAKTKRAPSNQDVPLTPRRDIVSNSCSIPPIPRSYVFRQIDPSGVTFSGVVGSAYQNAYYGQLNFLSNAAAFTSLFDQYKILAMRYTFIPRTNVVSGTAYNPPMYSCIDYDDAVPITSRSEMTQRSNVAVTQVYESLQRTFKPHVAVAAYSGTFTSYKNEPADWIDVLSPGVQHYGIKMFIDPCLSPAPVWDIEIEYWIEFRNVL